MSLPPLPSDTSSAVKPYSDRQTPRRPARIQVDPQTDEDDRPPQTGTAFNIWYLKWAGGDSTHTYVKAKTRCVTATDLGYTQGDKAPGSFLCYFFAKGCCHLGRKCQYLHRTPSPDDSFPPILDCFGRDKTADYRDDMTGVGSFNKINRTLYVCNLDTGTKHLEATLNRHFGEWGAIERTRVIPGKAIAFITFATEHGAQFAKEAMANQLLDGTEILGVKWAHQDPNPDAQKREQAYLDQQAVNTVKRLLEAIDEQEPKRQRSECENVESPAPAFKALPAPDTVLPAPSAAGLQFDPHSLRVLGQLLAQKRQVVTAPLQQISATAPALGSLLGSYGSSDEE